MQECLLEIDLDLDSLSLIRFPLSFFAFLLIFSPIFYFSSHFSQPIVDLINPQICAHRPRRQPPFLQTSFFLLFFDFWLIYLLSFVSMEQTI